jgi:hypothetical protein
MAVQLTDSRQLSITLCELIREQVVDQVNVSDIGLCVVSGVKPHKDVYSQ